MSEMGLEPTRLAPHEPESCASTNSATQTSFLFYHKNLYYSLLILYSFLSLNNSVNSVSK